MSEPAPAERSVRNRGLDDRGLPSRPGNPGTYVGEAEVDGRRYARFSAGPGTWVSASMKTMGYDQEYPARDGYGAYRGIVLDPSGRPLADPDRIRPGQEYLVPERTAPAVPSPPAAAAPAVPAGASPAPAGTAASAGTAAPAAATTPPAGTAAPAASPRSQPAADRLPPRAPAPSAAPPRLGLRPAPEAKPPSSSRQFRIPDDADLTPSERAEAERQLNDPSSERLVAEELRWLASDGIEQALAGRAEQEDFSDDNTGYTFVNDWLSDRLVPFSGAWTNAAMLFRRMREQADAGDLDNALLTGRIGNTALADARAEWDEYTRASLWLGEVMIGTAEEARRTGLAGNLRLAGQGVYGEGLGIGKALSDLVLSLRGGPLPAASRAMDSLIQSLVTVLNTALRLGRAYGKDPAEFMPAVIDTLSRQARDSVERLSRLPPDQQARAASQLFGEIDGGLLTILATDQVAGSLRADAAAATPGLAATRMTDGMRGLAVAGGPALADATAASVAAANRAAADAVQLAGFLSAFAIATGGGGGGGPRPPVSEGEVTTYGDYRERGTSKELEFHEPFPHSLLQDLGLATERGVGAASRTAIGIALKPQVHAVVGRYQRYFKVFYRSQRSGMTVAKIVSLNVRALRAAGIPESVVRDVSRQVLRRAVSLKINLKQRMK